MGEDCNHYAGTYYDKDHVKRCRTCDIPTDDYTLDDFK